MNELFGTTASVVAGCMVAMWILSLALRDASIVDIFRGTGFAVIGLTTFLFPSVDVQREVREAKPQRQPSSWSQR